MLSGAYKDELSNAEVLNFADVAQTLVDILLSLSLTAGSENVTKSDSISLFLERKTVRSMGSEGSVPLKSRSRSHPTPSRPTSVIQVIKFALSLMKS